MTYHPSALVSVPEMKTLSAGERAFTAWAATSRADGTPLMWTWSEMPHSQQERWEKIALAAAPAAPQAAGVGQRTHPTGEAIQDALIAGFLHGVGRDPWDDMHDYIAVCARDYVNGDPLPARAPSREPEGGAASRIAELEFELRAKTYTVEICEEQIERLNARIAALATREEAPAEAGEDFTEGAKIPDGAISGTDDGQTVWLESITGGAHRLGMWGGLSLRFTEADGSSVVRDYEDVNLRARSSAPEVRRPIELMRTREWRFIVGYSNDDENGGFTTLGDITDQLAALYPKSEAREVGVPVAWRWRLSPGRDWWVSVKPFEAGENEGEVQPLYTHPAPDALRVAVEALEPFAAMARVIEARDRMALGKVRSDNEVIASASWEGGLAVLTMGHLRDALTLAPNAKGWGGLYRRSPAIAALQAEQGAK